MLVLADRYFSGHPQVARIAATGADLIIRVQCHRRLPVLRELPDGSYLSVLPYSDHPSKAERDRARGQRLPRRGLKARQALGLPIRVVEYTVTVIPEIGQPRTESYRLITTLLDPDTAPAGHIARVYAERRESETGYADLKTYLRGHQQILRSKNPAGVAQELYALLIVYQLVQLARIQAAGNRPGQQPCDPDHISFTVVLRALIRSIGEPSSQRLLHDVLDEIWSQPLLTRRPRSKPRERKGTAAFAKACEQHPPSTVAYKLTMRTPDALTPANLPALGFAGVPQVDGLASDAEGLLAAPVRRDDRAVQDHVRQAVLAGPFQGLAQIREPDRPVPRSPRRGSGRRWPARCRGHGPAHRGRSGRGTSAARAPPARSRSAPGCRAGCRAAGARLPAAAR